MAQFGTIFKLDTKGFNLGRGLGLMAVMIAPLIVLGVLHQEAFYVSVAFGALFVGLSDPGGEYSYRLTHIAAVAILGTAPDCGGVCPSETSAGGGWRLPPSR